jgi:hypothetical protein
MMLALLFPSSRPNIRNLRSGESDELYPDGLRMGTLVLGKPGSGKTSWLARIIVWLMKHYPDRCIFVFDVSGLLISTIIYLILQEPFEVRERLLAKIIFLDLGNRDIVVPLPSFSPLYGTTYEEQAQIMARCFQKLAPDLVKNAPVLGGLALTETAPELFRLLTAIQNNEGECWQVTEAKRLLKDKGLLRKAVATFGGKVPEAKWYIEQDLLSDDMSRQERELRTFTFRAMLGLIEPRAARAMLGYPVPGFTPKDAIRDKKLVLIRGEKLVNQEPTQHVLITFIFMLIMAAVNQRRPGDPNDHPVTLVIDEVYALLRIPGMAEEIGKLAPLYRARKLELVIVIQALWQLEKELREKIWSLGNRVVFPVESMTETYEIAQENFHYFAQNVKAPATNERQHAIYETDRGAYLEQANWLQSLKHRELIMRRYINEQQVDPFIRHVARTKDIPKVNSSESVEEVLENLLNEIGIPVKDALQVVNKRNLERKEPKPPSV